jgi:N-acetylglucosamine-6-phosphate deacetylase
MQTAGLLDLQVNGFAGVDFNDAGLTADALEYALHAMLATGVTACLPTVITAPEDVMAARLAALDRAASGSRLARLMVPGYHMEGPFLNPEPGYAGCHPPASMPLPDPGLLARLVAGLQRPVLLLTLAPERPGAGELIRWALGRGVLVAMGHTAADAGVVAAAAGDGVRLSTHLGNALPHMQPKFLNPMMAQLAEDRLAASFIADGIHSPPPVLKVLLRAKGLERCILVTDATAAAGASTGLYGFAGMVIERAADGSVRMPGTERLAGSGLCLDQAVRNVIAWEIAPPGMAMRLASDHPAALLASALAAHGARLEAGSVTWSQALFPAVVRLNGIERRLP